MSLERAAQAARLWGFDRPRITLAAARENLVYRVEAAETYALRLHRVGYRSKEELRHELAWIGALAEAGLPVPRAVGLPSGGYVAAVEGQLVSVVTWVDGAPLGPPGEMDGVSERPAFCHRLGATMAALHQACDLWVPPAGFVRPAWDRAGLLGDAPLWGRFWEHPDLGAGERDLLLAARAKADAMLAQAESTLDYGLIHADLVGQNVMWDGETPGLIDFDDGGYGFRVFELATFLLRYMDKPDYPEIRSALCEGYAARAMIEVQELDLFLMLRAFTYPGWFMTRRGEPNTALRAARANATALKLAEAFMER